VSASGTRTVRVVKHAPESRTQWSQELRQTKHTTKAHVRQTASEPVHSALVPLRPLALTVFFWRQLQPFHGGNFSRERSRPPQNYRGLEAVLTNRDNRCAIFQNLFAAKLCHVDDS
jgi:hypothetical protein